MNMRSQVTSQTQSKQIVHTCDCCGKKAVQGRAFSFKSRNAPAASPADASSTETTKCFQCALKHLPMLKRSLIAALVVGTVLTALNQGDALLWGQWNNALYWKIPLTYCVPFIVASYGALINSRK
ncbi:MAG: nitrate/nitrite transporter NrtS [Chloroflexi bacterium]|nr:nitrate/nitrite transporter NrtS [Chloroflexota bacterium]MDA1218465.1 nitrate/nitrite transporter NrtS [Chloroflexota bacterium]